eukprot:SAG11_NODE_29944_length_305_cov_1.461165_1_plen_76_part_10
MLTKTMGTSQISLLLLFFVAVLTDRAAALWRDDVQRDPATPPPYPTPDDWQCACVHRNLRACVSVCVRACLPACLP